MAAKAKSGRKQTRLDLAEVPNMHRRQHSSFTRDILTPPGAPIVARHRARAILTPFEMRRAIIEDAAEKPEPVRLRSLRRRLTALDRALSDAEAEGLERVTSCIGSLSNTGCLNYLRSEVRSGPAARLPFSESKRLEIAAMSAVMKGLSPAHKSAVLELAVLLDPGHGGVFKLPAEFIATLQSAAGAVAALYGEWRHGRKTPPASAGSAPPGS
jgi:hypothetical protein